MSRDESEQRLEPPNSVLGVEAGAGSVLGLVEGPGVGLVSFVPYRAWMASMSSWSSLKFGCQPYWILGRKSWVELQ